MQTVDLLIALFYLTGTFAIGIYLARQNRTTEDMFAAGRQSPWWVAGLSSFMTIKSAGTFVVWGGLAYRQGVVAITVTSALGISGLIVGRFLAGRWRRSGVATPAEYVELRFGRPAVQLCSWTMLAVRIVTSGIALYSVSVMLAALMPLGLTNPLRDAGTGNVSVPIVIVALGFMVTIYTMAGGLWAVLVTDVLQFIILKLAILFVIPLIAWRVWTAPVLLQVPNGFFRPFSDEYTSWFVLGWIGAHVFTIGAEWAFAQRYISVPTERDARKSAYFFGALYLVSPTLWLAPAIMYRLLDAGAIPEQAYILASRSVLPAGMLGVMIAAMFSATASAVSGQINVFAGVLTEQFYARWHSDAGERQLVRAGRGFAILIGAAMTALGVLVPYLGGAERVIVGVSALMIPPLMAPVAWGLIDRRVGLSALFTTVGLCFFAAVLVRFGPQTVLAGTVPGAWLAAQPHLAEVLVGAVLPVLILGAASLLSRRESLGWSRVAARAAAYRAEPAAAGGPSHAPAGIIALALGASGAIMLGLLLVNESGRPVLLAFAAVLLLGAGISFYLGRGRASLPKNAAAGSITETIA